MTKQKAVNSEFFQGRKSDQNCCFPSICMILSESLPKSIPN